MFHPLITTTTTSTTSTLSVGSTGSQARLIQSSHPPAHYQPVLMKDLGKPTKYSPNQEIVVVDVFANAANTTAASYDEHTLTDTTVMDKHLCALEDDSISKTDTCDIAKYMANLKEKHMESEQLDNTIVITTTKPTTTSDPDKMLSKQQIQQQIIDQHQRDVAAAKSAAAAAAAAAAASEKSDTASTTSSSSSGSSSCNASKLKKSYSRQQSDEITLVIIDDQCDPTKSRPTIDKTPKSKIEQQSQKHNNMKTLRRSTQLTHSSPDRSKSTGSSPIRIIKIKSPRNSIDSGKCLSVSRDNSKERSPEKRRQSISPRRSSEGGILKRSCSPKPPSSDSCGSVTSSNSSILKRSPSPSNRKCLSPGNSIDLRSPDRNRLSPHSSFDCRSPDRRTHTSYSEPNLEMPRSALKNSPYSSFESRSPDRSGAHMRSLSAHSSLDKSKSPDMYSYPYNYQYYGSAATSPQRNAKRQSKSLDRTSSKDSNSSGGAYRYGLSPERVYHMEPARSQSVENAAACLRYEMAAAARSNESLTKSIEHPTCVECLYSRKPS